MSPSSRAAPFERRIAQEHLSDADVVATLDYPAYFDLLRLPHPSGHAGILHYLKEDRLVEPCEAGGWNITNLGALLLARKLDAFPGLRRKALRVVQYAGKDRTGALRERMESKGYAAGFEGVISYIDGLLPAFEVIRHVFREPYRMFPELAVRELVANALIHQDFLVTGAGPLVEIFDERIEITNPGRPVVDVGRLVDAPPRSRNEAIASLMRRFQLCEELGTGIDKALLEIEREHLPAPLFETPNGSTRVVLYARRPFAEMSRTERLRACYQHACLRQVSGGRMSNASLRERLGLAPGESARVTKLLKDAVAEGLVALHDPKAAPRDRTYVPWWAAGEADTTTRT